MRKLLFLLALFATPALAQNLPSGSPRVQGVPDGYGDPVQVTIVGSDGSNTPTPLGEWVVGADIANTNLTTPRATNGATYPLNTVTMAFNPTSSGWAFLRGDTNALSVALAPSATFWNYSNGASGILSNTTTAVTIKAAAGAGVRNYIDSCTFNTTAFGAAVPLAIRDGAAGTVKWSANVPTAGWLQPVTVTFRTPLQGTANTLFEIVTTTANTSGTVWASCQGHTGA